MTRVLTTAIGSFPKPDYVPVRDWFQKQYSTTFDAFYFDNRDLETRFALATQGAVTAQVDAGIDVPTDGEMRREHYIFYRLRHLTGVEFEHLQPREIRTGAWEREVPTIIDWSVPTAFSFRTTTRLRSHTRRSRSRSPSPGR